MRGDAKLDVNENAEADQAEDKNERDVRCLPADDGRFVESEVDQDKTGDTSESPGKIEFHPPLGFNGFAERWRRSLIVCRHHEKADHTDQCACNGQSPERPLPPALFCAEGGESGTDDHSYRTHAAKTRDGEVALESHWECAADQSQAVRYQEGRTHALHCSASDEHSESIVVAEPAEHRPDGEPHPTDDENLLVAKHVTQSTGWEYKSTQSHTICGRG